jgi:hypothetical protein
MTNENGSNPLLPIFDGLMAEYVREVEDCKAHTGEIPSVVALRLPRSITGEEALALLGMAYLAFFRYELTFLVTDDFCEIGIHH